MHFRKCLFVLGMIPFGCFAQLSNRLFLLNPATPTTKLGLTLDALQYIRNSEYYHNLNPGSTLFGFQLKPTLHYKLSDKASIQTGLLLQQNFGEPTGFSRVIPFFNIGMGRKKWNFNLGNISPHIHHRLPEPLMDFENPIRVPIEGGIQALRLGRHSDFDAWLHWKESANAEKGRQEKIVFGQRYERRWRISSRITLNIPLYAIVYHEGGQALNVSSHVSTRIALGQAVRLGRSDSLWNLEGFVFQSLDNSETPGQPYKSGWASLLNLNFRPGKNHELAISWWFAREFVSPVGSPVFNNVNYNDVYLNRNSRRLIMLRYVFSRPVVGNKIWVDFRLEPYYDMEYGSVEFAQGLFFRYVETLSPKLPWFIKN